MTKNHFQFIYTENGFAQEIFHKGAFRLIRFFNETFIHRFFIKGYWIKFSLSVAQSSL